MLFRILDALADGIRNLTGLAEPEAHRAVAVAHHYQSGEFENTAALHGLADTVDRDDPLFQFHCICVNSGQSMILPFLRT